MDPTRTWPSSRFDPVSRDAVLDTGMVLWSHRRALVRALAEGPVPGCDVVAAGDDINPWLLEHSAGWQHLLSVRPTATVDQLRLSLPNNRARVLGGTQMVSIFDYERLDDAARQLIVDETVGTYLFACTEVEMKIVNRTSVFLSGPVVEGRNSVMLVQHATVLEAALRYWNAVMASAVDCAEERAAAPDLTPRQWRVIALLRRGLTDESVARELGLSVRTVRAEVAGILDVLHVRSRFSAGFRLGRISALP